MSRSSAKRRRPTSSRIGLALRELIVRRETGESIALFRIACGLCTLTWISSAIMHGVAGDMWLQSEFGGYQTFASLPWLFELLGGMNPTTLWLVIGLYIAASLAVILGLGGRFSALVLLQTFLAISQVNWGVSGGDCRLAGNCLWLLVLAGGTATMSLDCRLRTGSWTSRRPVAAWPRHLIFLQLVIVYCTTGLQKISIVWTPAGGYSALYYILQEPSWQRWDMSWLAWIYPLTQFATAATWIWEISAPLLILAAWYRATRHRSGRLRRLFNRIGFRRVYVASGIMMHLGVFLFIDLSLFTWISLSMYTCLFTPTEWRNAWARVFRIRKRCRLPRVKHAAATTTADAANTRTRHGLAENARTEASENVVASTVGRTARRLQGPCWNRRLVGVLVAFHVLAISLAALPAPPESLTRDDFQSEDVAADLAAWTRRLNGLGINISQERLGNSLWQAASRYGHLRRVAMSPFQPYYEFCGTSQGWRMFVGAHRFPTRLHIDIQLDGRWQPIYVQGSGQHDWLRTRLNHEHWRTVIFTMVVFRDATTYRQFANWVARQAKADFPSATAVRVRVYKFRTPSPAEVRSGESIDGQFGDVLTVAWEND